MGMTPEKSFPPCVLFLEQESYLSCINLDCKNLNYRIYTTIFKNCIQKTIYTIIGENEPDAIKNRTMLHIFSITRDVIDVSKALIV